LADAAGNSNGAGKSTLFEGISWVLYGKTAKGIKAGEVMRRLRKRGKKCFGKLTFTSETRGKLIITRTQAAKGAKLEVELAGKPWDGRSKDMQKDIVELLGVSYEFFRQMVYFGQDAAEFFSQMGDADRKQVLSKLIGLEWYEAALKEIKALHTESESALQTDKGDLERLIAGARVVSTRVQELKSQIKDWRGQQNDRIEKAASEESIISAEVTSAKMSQQREVEEFESSVKDEWANVDQRESSEADNVAESVGQQFETRRKSFEGQVERLSNQLDGARKLVDALPTGATQLEMIAETEKQLKAARVAQQDKLAELAAARQTVKTITADRDKKNRILSGAESIKPGTRCESCGTEVTDETKDAYLIHLKKEFEDLRDSLSSAKDLVTSLNDEWADANTVVEKLMEKLSKEQKKHQAIEACLRDVKFAEESYEAAQTSGATLDQDQKDAHEKQMIQMRGRHKADRMRMESDVERRRSNLVQTQKRYLEAIATRASDAAIRLENLKAEVCPYDAQLESSKASMKTFVKDQQDQEESIRVREVEIEGLEFWVKGFGREGIPAALLDGFCTRFTEEANAMLSSLGTGIRVRLSPSTQIKSGEVRDRLDYTITTKSGESSYKQLSGGEKVRIDVVSMLTLHSMAATQYGIKEGLFGILILDEVFSALDPAGCMIVYQLLEEFKARASYVISHNDLMKALFRSSLLVRKIEENSVVI